MGAIGGCIVVAVEREIKFAPQTRFSPAISRYRKHGRLTNSQLHFRTTARFEPAQIERARAIVQSYSARRNWHEMNANCCTTEKGKGERGGSTCVITQDTRVHRVSTATINIIQYISISIPRKFSSSIHTKRPTRGRANEFLANWYENADNTSYLTSRIGMKTEWEGYNYFSVKSGYIAREMPAVSSATYWECGEIHTAVFVSIYIFLQMLNRWSLYSASNDVAGTLVVPIILRCVKKKCSKHVIYYSSHAWRLHTVAEPTSVRVHECEILHNKSCPLFPNVHTSEGFIFPTAARKAIITLSLPPPGLYQGWMRRWLRRVWK